MLDLTVHYSFNDSSSGLDFIEFREARIVGPDLDTVALDFMQHLYDLHHDMTPEVTVYNYYATPRLTGVISDYYVHCRLKIATGS